MSEIKKTMLDKLKLSLPCPFSVSGGERYAIWLIEG